MPPDAVLADRSSRVATRQDCSAAGFIWRRVRHRIFRATQFATTPNGRSPAARGPTSPRPGIPIAYHAQARADSGVSGSIREQREAFAMEFLRAYGDQLMLVLVLGLSVFLVSLPILCRIGLAERKMESSRRRSPVYSPPAETVDSSLASTRTAKSEPRTAAAGGRLPGRAMPAH